MKSASQDRKVRAARKAPGDGPKSKKQLHIGPPSKIFPNLDNSNINTQIYKWRCFYCNRETDHRHLVGCLECGHW